jgi:hypothetical protein
VPPRDTFPTTLTSSALIVGTGSGYSTPPLGSRRQLAAARPNPRQPSARNGSGLVINLGLTRFFEPASEPSNNRSLHSSTSTTISEHHILARPKVLATKQDNLTFVLKFNPGNF